LPFPFAGNKRKLPFLLVPFSVCRILEMCMETWTYRHGYGDIETWGHGSRDMETWKHGNMETWRHHTENGKRKPKQFSLIRLPFAPHPNGSWSFVHLLTKKQTEVICLQTD
jgi:hypothetical protein